jgi:hypothetical protein
MSDKNGWPGMVLVPLEPTDAMIKACLQAALDFMAETKTTEVHPGQTYPSPSENARRCWRAMVLADSVDQDHCSVAAALVALAAERDALRAALKEYDDAYEDWFQFAEGRKDDPNEETKACTRLVKAQRVARAALGEKE